MPALKIIISFIFFFNILVFPLFTYAQTSIPESLKKDNFNYFINGQTTIEGALFHTVFCTTAGISPYNKCLGYQPRNNKNESAKPMVFDRIPNGGALGVISSTIALTYSTPPTSSIYYLARISEGVGITPKTAYAQVGGSGENIIAPVFKLWQVARNLAYLIFIVIFLVVGLMIMFRQKISQQAVIGIQQALPGLVVGLILVTFSYFIAALIVDLTFIAIQLVTQFFISSGMPNSLGNEQQLRDIATNNNVFNLFSSSAFNMENLGTAGSGASGQIEQTFGGLSAIIPAIIAGIAGVILLWPLGLAGAGIGAVIGGVAGFTSTDWLIPALVIIVLIIALFFQMFRLFFALISSYIQILIFTIGGPFYILIGAIPGRGNTINSWWRGLLGNVLVFPAVFAAFLFAGVILGNPSSFNNTTLPLFGGVDGNFIRAIIAYGILLGAPAIPDMVRNALGVKGPQGLTQAATQGLQRGFGGTQDIGTIARGGIRRAYYGTGLRANLRGIVFPGGRSLGRVLP